jgi:periplasmic protein TonB
MVAVSNVVTRLNAAVGKGGIMRWSFWPVSITLHVLIAISVFIVPLLAEVQPPVPAPLHFLLVPLKTVPIPPDVLASAPLVRTPRLLPNVIAPFTLEAERKDPIPPVGDLIPNVPDGAGPIDPALLGPASLARPTSPVIAPPEPKPMPTVVRAGQGVREPKRISGAMPEYPAIARSARVQGAVMIEAVINERGEVGRIRVLKSIPLLDAPAISAVQQWRYTPTLLNGVPVSVLMTITVNFTLQN